MRLTQESWKKISEFIPAAKKGPQGQGRPPRPKKDVLEGMLWVLKSGARWKDLPKEYPPYQTCHRIFQEWQNTGVFEQILCSLSSELEDRGELKGEKVFVDGSFVESKKGGLMLDMAIRDTAVR
jgi:hypothetical protein